jgi:hypothetical protein
MARTGEMRNAYTVSVGNLKCMNHYGYLGVDATLI